MTPAETLALELICKYGIWLHPRTREEFANDIGEAMNRVAREIGQEWQEKVWRLERERAELVARCAAIPKESQLGGEDKAMTGQELAIQKMREAVEAIKALPHALEVGNPAIQTQSGRNADALGRAEYALGMLRPRAWDAVAR